MKINLNPTYLKALWLYKQKKWQAAANELQKVRQQDPDNAAVLFKLGMCHYRLKQWTRAAERMTEALTLAPKNLNWSVQQQKAVKESKKSKLTKLKATPKVIGNAVVQYKSKFIQISGWVVDMDSDVQRGSLVVDLYVEDLYLRSIPVQDTLLGFSCLVEDSRVGFIFKIKGNLMKYFRPEDIKIKYLNYEFPLTISGKNWPTEIFPLEELRRKLSGGMLISKKGYLMKSLKDDKEWSDGVGVIYTLARKVFKSEFDLDLSIAYGTLLGYARGGEVIIGDDDFDSVYLSKHTDPAEVRAEFIEISAKLASLGYDVKMSPSGRLIKWVNGKFSIDIFPSWFDDRDYNILYSVSAPLKKSVFSSYMDVDFLGCAVLVPVGYKEILFVTYGEDWVIPNPSFQWSNDRKNNPKLLAASLSSYDRVRLHWERAYHSSASPALPSPFYQFSKKYIDKFLISSVIDLGCGNGRDSFAFSVDYSTLGLDYSISGISTANNLAVERKLAVKFACVDVSDLSRLYEVGSSFKDEPVALYSRFFLHAIPESYEDNVLLFAASLPVGSLVLLEFRTNHDEGAVKYFGQHYRRFLSLDRFLSKVDSLNVFEVVFHEEGYGMAVYKDEDPHVARVVLRRKVGISKSD